MYVTLVSLSLYGLQWSTITCYLISGVRASTAGVISGAKPSAMGSHKQHTTVTRTMKLTLLFVLGKTHCDILAFYAFDSYNTTSLIVNP